MIALVAKLFLSHEALGNLNIYVFINVFLDECHSEVNILDCQAQDDPQDQYSLTILHWTVGA